MTSQSDPFSSVGFSRRTGEFWDTLSYTRGAQLRLLDRRVQRDSSGSPKPVPFVHGETRASTLPVDVEQAAADHGDPAPFAASPSAEPPLGTPAFPQKDPPPPSVSHGLGNPADPASGSADASEGQRRRPVAPARQEVPPQRAPAARPRQGTGEPAERRIIPELDNAVLTFEAMCAGLEPQQLDARQLREYWGVCHIYRQDRPERPADAPAEPLAPSAHAASGEATPAATEDVEQEREWEQSAAAPSVTWNDLVEAGG